MTPLALIAKEAKCIVTGSDVEQEFITDAALKKAGITPFAGFAPEHIAQPDLVITTGAHGGFDNIEVQTAKSKNIPVMSAGEALGAFMEGKIFGREFMGISVAGTHGKTTTTAMLATMLKENKLDPTYVIGTGDVGSLGAPGHLGKGKHFVAEADEYATEPQHDKTPRFLWQHPHIAIITNIEFDHPDIYGSIDAVRAAFSQFINKLPANGTVIAYGDDHEIRKMLRTYNKKVITYGFNPDNQYVFKRVTLSGEQLFFWIESHGTSLGQFRLHVSGEHNALNALAVIITGLELGVPLEKIRKGLLAFRGSKRRLEYIGETLTGAKVYDDYAHHPTEIKTIIKTLKQQYPKKHIIAIFQPHTYSRTKKLFGEFQRSFEDIDTVIITDIYASLREKPDTTVSAQLMIEGMRSLHREVLYLPQLSDVVKYINKKRYRANTVIVTMGAGDVYTIHSEIGIQDE